MPTKIETHLTPEQLHEFCRRVAQTKGGTKLATIQAIADEFGVEISLMAASSFRDGPLAGYLDELKRKREMAEQVSEVAKSGLSLSDATASVLTQKIFDQALALDTTDENVLKQSNGLSLALSRLRLGDQRAKLLDVKVRELEQKLALQQFDAAAAVLEHAKEIRLVVADTKLDAKAKTERVRKILFGEAPADFKPVDRKGGDEE